MKEDIIAMARRAGAHDDGDEVRFVELRYLERFAALVAAAERELAFVKLEQRVKEAYQDGHTAGAKSERESCAKVCDDRAFQFFSESPFFVEMHGLADAIRNRGNT
jgi:hypothetical protein